MSREALIDIRVEAAECRACPLWEPATQTVFGEGDPAAPVMFVGEQPGNEEDLVGRPFVGPAGRLFEKALSEIGIERSRVYITNAVKHFKFAPRGKRRLHQKPSTSEIQACHPWLANEIRIVRPSLIVAMGATATRSVFGKALPIGTNRGRLVRNDGEPCKLITVHPSALLRVPEKERREIAYANFLQDLRLALPFVERAQAA